MSMANGDIMYRLLNLPLSGESGIRTHAPSLTYRFSRPDPSAILGISPLCPSSQLSYAWGDVSSSFRTCRFIGAVGGIRTLAAAINRPNDLAGRPLHQLEYHRIFKTLITYARCSNHLSYCHYNDRWDSNPQPTGWIM